MTNETKTPALSKTGRLAKYLLLIVASLAILLVCGLFANVPLVEGEYRYSSFIQAGYFTVGALASFFIVGFVAGYFWKLNPWLSGLCLFLIFPVTAIYEGTVYPGSHNLIPFEFIFFFAFALPSVLAVYLGRHTFKENAKRATP